jgi:predicted site-specific integrase-resolvase
MSDRSRFLTTKRASQLYSMSAKTLRYLVKIGKLKSYPMPTGSKRKTLLFRPEEIEQLLAGDVLT